MTPEETIEKLTDILLEAEGTNPVIGPAIRAASDDDYVEVPASEFYKIRRREIKETVTAVLYM